MQFLQLMKTLLLVLLSCSLLVGCGSKEKRYELSGKVTYNGKPIPEGYIVFEPDSSSGGATGAAGQCKILDGLYNTSNEDGKGTLGGPHNIRIMGFNGKIGGGKGGTAMEVALPVPLFAPYELKMDLPKEDSTLDFEVPAN